MPEGSVRTERSRERTIHELMDEPTSEAMCSMFLQVELLDQAVEGVEEVLLERRLDGRTDALDEQVRLGSRELGEVREVVSDLFKEV